MMGVIRRWWRGRLVRFVYGPKVARVMAWKSFSMGMTGHGTSPYDTVPGFANPYLSLPHWLREMVDEEAEIEGRFRRGAWRESMEEVCGPNSYEGGPSNRSTF